MKAKLSRMLRSALALLLAFSMVVGYVPAAVFAQEKSAEPIKYVSLGDSMTNGYGLPGYGDGRDGESNITHANSGVEDYGTGSYANQLADYLAETNNCSVDHAQLAMSGIRTEDIHWLLELDYEDQDTIDFVQWAVDNQDSWNEDVAAKWNAKFGCGDFWTVDEIINHSRTEWTRVGILNKKGIATDYNWDSCSASQKIAIIAEYFQEKVAAADVISLSVANGNIGVFGFGRILEAIGFDKDTTYLNYNYEDVLRECDSTMKAKLNGLINELKPMLQSKIDNEALVNVGLYIAVSLAMNYAGTLDAILQMNPDVEIILVPVMNTFSSENTEGVEGITLGALMEYVVDPINKFIAGLPTYMQTTNHEVYKDAKFYYAEPGYIECVVDTYEAPLEGTVRDRFVESIVGDHGDGMIWGMLGDMVEVVTTEEVVAYEAMTDAQKLAYAAGAMKSGEDDTTDYTAKAKSIAIYLAFENAIIANKLTAVTLESVMGLGSTSLDFDAIMEAYGAKAAEAGKAKLETVVAFMVTASGMDENVIKALLGDEAAIKALAWAAHPNHESLAGNTGHMNIEDVLACDDCMNQGGHYSSEYIVNAYNDLMANPVYGVVALQSDGLLTGAEVKTLYEGECSNDTIYSVMAGKSGDMLDAAAVANLDSVGVYPFVALMQDSSLTGDALTTAAQMIETAYNSGGEDLPDGMYAQISALLDLHEGMQTLKGMKETFMGSVETAAGVPAMAESLCTLLVTPDVLGDVVAESELKGLLALFGRCVIGNGIGSHPAQAGHNELARAVKEAYGKKTAEDKTDENIDFEQWPIAKQIISDLTAQNLLNDDQIIAIAEVVFNQYMTTGGIEMAAVVDTAYNTVLKNADLTDAQRLEVISIVYNNVKGLLPAEAVQYTALLEDIIAALDGKVSDAKAFDLVNMLYGMYQKNGFTDEDGNINSDAVRFVIGYIWNVTLGLKESNEGAAGSGSSSSSSGELSVAEKLDIIKSVMDVLATNDEIKGTYPQVEAVVELYEELTAGETEEEKLIPDAVMIELFDKVMETVGGSGIEGEELPELTEEVISEVTTEIAETILVSDKIAPEDKVVILEKVADTLGEVGMGDVVGGDDSADYSKYLADLNVLRAALAEAGYLSAEQEGKIIEAVGAVLVEVLGGNEPDADDLKPVAEKVYQIIFVEPDLTLAQKFEILLITYTVLDELGYVDMGYAAGYAMAKEQGYVDMAIEYIDVAIEAVADAKKAAKNFKVAEELEEAKEALLKEFDATTQTLNAIKVLLDTDALATKDGAWTELLNLKSELDNHIAKLTALALEIGYAADPYIQKVVDAYNYYAKLISDIAAETYAQMVAGIEQFKADYAALVEEIGLIADKLHPDLGAAVRKYLTETPADALVILFAHGEDAVAALIAIAGAATGEAEVIFSGLALVAGLYGEDIYTAIAESDGIKAIMAEIEVAYGELMALYEKFEHDPLAVDYSAEIAAAQNKVLNLYGKLFNAIGIIISDVTGVSYTDLVNGAWEALMGLIDVTGNAAGNYGAWISQDVQILLAQQLAALFANNDEFMQVFMPLFIQNVTAVNEYLTELAVKYGNEAWNIYVEIRDVVIPCIIDTIKEYGDQAWAQIKAQLDTLCEMAQNGIAAIQEIINKLQNKLEELKNKVQNEANALIEQIEAMLEDLKDLLAKAEGLSEEVLEQIYAAIENVEKALEDLKEIVEGNFESVYELLSALAEAKADLLNALNNLVDLLEKDAKDVYDQISKRVNTVIDAVNCLIDNRDEIVKEIGLWLLEELVEALPTIDQKLYDFFYNNPDKVIAFFENYGDLIVEHGMPVAAVLGYIAANYGPEVLAWVIENPEEALTQFVAWYEQYGDRTWAMIEVYLEELGVFDAIDDALTEQLGELAGLLAPVLDALGDHAEGYLNELLNDVNALIAQIEKQLAVIDGQAKKQLEIIYEAALNLKAAIENAIKEATEAAIEELLKAAIALDEAVKNAAEQLNEQVVAQIEALINQIMACVNELYWSSTHDYYFVNEDSYYVAIGDGTAVSESYVDALAAELGVDYKNLAESGMMVADVFALLEEQTAEIEKADLITVGFGSNAFLDYAIDRAVRQELAGRSDGEAPAPLDWSKYVGSKGAAVVEQELEKLYNDFTEKGLGVVTLTYDTDIYGITVTVTAEFNLAELLTVIVESYAYAVTSYAFELPQVVDEIHEINENAVIAIVGMYNPIDNVTISLGEMSVEIGEYVDYLVDAANVHNFTYAMLTDKAIFVEAEDVETQIVAAGTEGAASVDALSFLMMYINADIGAIMSGDLDTVTAPCGEATNPSAKGHEYIKTQIYESLILLKPVEVKAARMVLGNELKMQFAIEQSDIIDGVEYAAVITKTYADGKADKTVIVPQSEWTTYDKYYLASFNGIAAKEMGDEIYVQIITADGTEMGGVWEDSVEMYAMRQLKKATEPVIQTMYVEMLNYGAAAQVYFEYDAENLVNADLTEEQKGYGLEAVKLENNRVADENYEGSQLNLVNSIQLRMQFKNIDSSMYAIASFTNHLGKKVETRIEGTEFIHEGRMVVVKTIVAADYKQDVTVTVYNADGEAVATAVDSVASYIARMSGEGKPAIYDAVAKFTAAAYNYLHRND